MLEFTFLCRYDKLKCNFGLLELRLSSLCELLDPCRYTLIYCHGLGRDLRLGDR